MGISKDKRGDLIISDAKISSRNFSGNRFGVGGAKGFCVRIESPEWAQELADEGWNVKFKQSTVDPDAEPRMFIPVAINFNELFHPNIYMYSGHNRIRLENATVPTLDNADIEKIDLVIHGRKITDRNTGETRIKAYVKTGHFKLEDDPFADDYAEYDKNVMKEDASDDESGVPFDM